LRWGSGRRLGIFRRMGSWARQESSDSSAARDSPGGAIAGAGRCQAWKASSSLRRRCMAARVGREGEEPMVLAAGVMIRHYYGFAFGVRADVLFFTINSHLARVT
jgi:hypothetical protein